MPKIKTHQSTAKRFRYSGSGKLMRMRQGKGHLRRKKSRAIKSTYDSAHVMSEASARRRIKRLAPHI